MNENKKLIYYGGYLKFCLVSDKAETFSFGH